MSDSWPLEFARRMREFGEPFAGAGTAVSVKVRVVGGCFHREHSSHAYRLIDAALRDPGLEPEAIRWQEHESGPEVLVWLPLVTAGVAFSAAVINLIVSVLKARAEGVRAGDRAREPVELIVRTSREGVVEERVLRFSPEDPVHAAAVGAALNEAARKMLPAGPRREPQRKAQPKKGARRQSERREHASLGASARPTRSRQGGSAARLKGKSKGRP